MASGVQHHKKLKLYSSTNLLMLHVKDEPVENNNTSNDGEERARKALLDATMAMKPSNHI